MREAHGGAVLQLRAGEWVTVRGLDEIHATLDAHGTLDGLPFMPEMERYAGRRFRVWRRADRVCVEGQPTLRRVANAVFLEELRCDGAMHAGCQRGCLFVWKEAWLSRGAPDRGAWLEVARASGAAALGDPAGAMNDDEVRWTCQSTQLGLSSEPVPWWNVRAYLRDVRTGNLTAWELARSFALTLGTRVSAVRRRMRRRARGTGERTPEGSLGLTQGELVEVRSLAEIEETLDERGRNRGLEFSPGMDAFCGRRFRVRKRLDQIIYEPDGRLRRLRDTVVLDGVDCDGMCSRGCPRRNHLYWREIWLKRVEPVSGRP